ncbi:MAG: hypothetical protein MRZ79_09550 [Bacteroidia bacterium]|nr:hypothetical protein [Bacteroidia bacterium]
MEEMIKKFVYTSVGMLSAASEKLQEAVDDFVGSGKESKEEGKKIMNDFQSEMDKQQSELEERGKALMATIEENMPSFKTENLPWVKDILSRLEAIEKKLEEKDNDEKGGEA